MKVIRSCPSWHFGVTIFLSSYLLFAVQPILGRYVLPWFGGTSTVWTTCMLVYQMLLLMGYLYAYAAIKISIKKQSTLHILILAASAILLLSRIYSGETPVSPAGQWKPIDASLPAWRIGTILVACIGLPFFLLASTSTLLQSWFSRLYPASSPYTFYTISNIGSLIGLISYPFIIEPFTTLRTQSFLWSAGYSVFILLCAYVAFRMQNQKLSDNAASSCKLESKPDETAKPSFGTCAAWLFFSLCSSTILLATTNQITQNVAPVPLLWVLPLSVYLLSYAICFRQNATLSGDAWIPITLASQCIALYSMHLNSFLQIAAYTFALFSCCMLSHKELYRTKPDPMHLGTFYLMIAIGGALGGVFVGIVAPFVFRNFFEFEFIYIVYSLITVCILATQRQKWMQFLWLPLGVVALAIVILLHLNARGEKQNAIWQSRNFYGSLRVLKCRSSAGYYNELINGRIKHGIQFESGPLRTLPTEYFHKGSGVGMAFRYHIKRLAQQPLRVGAIGLGIGTIASYGETNDLFRFYEINPDVIKLASDPEYFTYLADCPARLDIIPGDARISMERERLANKPQAFDILVVDAFNSDAIPVHLLTREAFELYLYHMAPDGIMAVHVSNLYLDLIPVVISAAQYFDLDYAVMKISGDRIITQISIWILVTRNRAFIDIPAISDTKATITNIAGNRGMWTDDYSNMFSVLKKH